MSLIFSPALLPRMIPAPAPFSPASSPPPAIILPYFRPSPRPSSKDWSSKCVKTKNMNIFISACRGINGIIIHEIRKKDAVRQKLRKSPFDDLLAKFKDLRVKVKQMVRERNFLMKLVWCQLYIKPF